MTMMYTSLIAPKGTSGSIANWVGYSKLDLPTVLDEAQSLLYSLLRVRNMRTEWTFGVASGQSEVALPSRFLDPIGAVQIVAYSSDIRQRPDFEVKSRRNYDDTFAGIFGSDPVSTTADSSLVTLAIPGHGLTQGSTIAPLALDAVGGIVLSGGSFAVVSVPDPDTLVIDAVTEASATATGGGDKGTWTANQLLASMPRLYGIWDESLKFECAFDTAQACKMLYYRSPLLLSSDNPSNWLTARYPRLLRTACQVQSADFMKDTEEYNKALQALTAQVQSVSAEDDLIYRGADIITETP